MLTFVERLGLTRQVRFLRAVSDQDLVSLYNAASLFVFPSLYEGFGLPPLEAMACGTAVISSTASSLPEVVGEAGLLIDPADTEALAKAMEQVLSDTEMRKQMQSAGLVQAQNFSWEKTARQTIESYRRALTPDGGKKGV
jgi:glycosyltransferase involved in cell wall biosynthesis